ncbi:MAG: LexA family transcriptional regulator [Phycisphaerae bacterium]|jgi:SOS-response transcriptional repressor LexA
MSLGAIIRQRREELGLTQDRLAAQSGISKPYLSNIETGKAKNPPTDGVLRSLERALGYRGAELMRLAHLARTPADVRDQQELLEAEVQKLRGVLKELISVGGGKSGAAKNMGRLARTIAGGGNVSGLSAGLAIPVINKVSAGHPQHFTDLDYPPSIADEYIRCVDLHDSQAFAARVVGDSMEPDYHEGDVVVFSPNTPAANGDDCFARFADDGGTTFKRLYQDQESNIRLQPLNNKYPAQVYPRESISGLWPAVFRIQPVRKGG